MSFKSKYIIVKQGGITTPVVFGDAAKHSDVARGFMPAVIVGAGFCHINVDGRYDCYGESTSLNIKSNGDADSKLLNTFLGVDY